jgi:hypothetical protein
MSERHDPDPAEREDLAVATLAGRNIERREQGAAPRVHDLLSVAAEFGPLTGRPATEGGTPWRACGWAGIGPPAGRAAGVPDNVRALDEAHVEALAGSIKLQGMLVPLVVREHADGFELVAGFHRIAAAQSLGLAEVPVVVRDADTEDADRAVENITSCRCRHDVIYADSVVMPMSGLKCPTVRCGPGGEVGIRTRTDPGSQAEADDLANGLPLDFQSERAIDALRHARVSSLARAHTALAETVALGGARQLRPPHRWTPSIASRRCAGAGRLGGSSGMETDDVGARTSSLR